MASNPLSNEATDVDLAAYEALAALGWKRGDTLLYQQSYALTEDEQKDFPGSKSIKPDFVLVDLQGMPLAVMENKLELLYDKIPSNFYDLVIVDECHRGIMVKRDLVFDHFVCPRIGLTATPKIAVPADGAKVDDEDLAINDTYRLFGCESGTADYEFGLD